MRVRVDLDLCQGHGVCANESPEVFELDGDVARVIEEQPAAERHEGVRLAAKYCPTGAITIEEE